MNAEKLLKAGLAASLLFLAGCKAGPEVTAQDAAEVALDDAGFTPESVTNLTSDASEEGFTVSFHTDRGIFTYVISSGGLIEDRKYQKDQLSVPVETGESGEDAESAAKEDAVSDKDSDASDTESKKDSSKKDTKKETSGRKRTPDEETAVSLALNNAGLTESDVADLDVTVNGDTATVTFRYGDYLNTVEVDVANGQVISSLIG